MPCPLLIFSQSDCYKFNYLMANSADLDQLASSLTHNLLGFSPLWFKPRSGHMWQSQVQLMDGQVVFPQVLRFSPTFDEWSALYIEDIQMFGVNMTFISSSEVKKCIFHECRRHEWNIHFFTSRDEIKVIFTTNIWIFFLLYTSLSIEKMQILYLQGKVWHAVLSLGAMTFMFCFVWWR